MWGDISLLGPWSNKLEKYNATFEAHRIKYAIKDFHVGKKAVLWLDKVKPCLSTCGTQQTCLPSPNTQLHGLAGWGLLATTWFPFCSRHIQVLKDGLSFLKKKNETNATSNYLVFPFNKYKCKVLSLSFFCWVIVDLQYYYCFRCTKIGNTPQIFVSSLHTSHANNLSILPILVRACLLGHVGLFAIPWTTAQQAPLSMRFARQEYWSGLPLPPLGKSSRSRDQTHISCIGRRVLYHCTTWEAQFWCRSYWSDHKMLSFLI